MLNMKINQKIFEKKNPEKKRKSLEEEEKPRVMEQYEEPSITNTVRAQKMRGLG